MTRRDVVVVAVMVWLEVFGIAYGLRGCHLPPSGHGLATVAEPTPAVRDAPQLYALHCAPCHGPVAYVARTTRADARRKVDDGYVGVMPSFRRVLDAAQRDAIVSYVTRR